jgi:RNA polymerase sigma factor (sigma-70 family)
MVARDERDRVREALRLLGLACRRLIHLRFGEELSHREIARRLQSTEGSVRVRVHRCLQRLREAVKELSLGPASGQGDD